MLASLGIKDEEVQPLIAGFAGFLFALGGYFLLVPLRDEAGVALGTDKLPRLFIASLLLTFLATPLASAFLNRSPARERGLQQLFRALSLSILGFMLLYLAAGTPAATNFTGDPDAAALQIGGKASDAATVDVMAGVQQDQQERRHRRLLAVPGAAQLTWFQASVRAAFFLWASLLNLVATSSLWARSADVFSPEAAGRLFGLLGAGATLGQLLGSLAAGALAGLPALRGGIGSPSLLPMLVSAAALELAGQAAGRYRVVRVAAESGSPVPVPGDVNGEDGLMAEQGSSTSINLARLSSGSTHMTRAAGKASAQAQTSAGSSSKGGAGGVDGSRKANGGAALSSGSTLSTGGLLRQLPGRTLEGYRLIRASPYLLHMCLYLALNYVTSSFFYFEKTLVVARVRDAASRTAWFATINSTSAFFILALQLLATGRVLRHLGLPLALGILPATAGLLMAAIALWPVPAAVAGAEVVRKIVAYSLARPARENLFTVVNREEKYKAKLVLDTVVQRVGDSLAAAAFQVLVPGLGFGPSGVAAACVPVCMIWAGAAYRLGQRQQKLAAAATRVPS